MHTRPMSRGWDGTSIWKKTMDFPFEARCLEEQDVSPLNEGETVRVVGKPSTEPSLRQQFVTIEWMDR